MIKYKKITNRLVCLICLFIVSSLFLGINKLENTDGRKIFKRIYIENVNVGGMTIEEAETEINKIYNIKNIYIKYNEKTWCLNPKEIELNYNIDKSLKEAYRYTRNDDKLENIKRFLKLIFKEEYKISLYATYNEIKLSDFINQICKEIDIKVQEATITIKDSGEIIRTPSKEGVEVDKIKLKEKIYSMIAAKDIKLVELPVNIIRPTVTTEDVESINSVLSQYSTSFNEHSSRGMNIHVAGESSSDRLIMPQEIFSYNKSTGARTWSNGYKSAKVIVGGRYVNGEGGGVCQVSTTIYNAALLSALPIEEVHNHTFPSRYAPRGRDAAVSYGYTDLKFKNPYSHPIYIKNIVKNGAITSKIYGCSQDIQKVYVRTEEKYEKNKIVVKTYRIYLDEENNKIREELVATSEYKIK